MNWGPNVKPKSINFEVLKYNTNDTSMANDYFEKPAKLIEKMEESTSNHS